MELQVELHVGHVTDTQAHIRQDGVNEQIPAAHAWTNRSSIALIRISPQAVWRRHRVSGNRSLHLKYTWARACIHVVEQLGEAQA